MMNLPLGIFWIAVFWTAETKVFPGKILVVVLLRMCKGYTQSCKDTRSDVNNDGCNSYLES